MAHLPAAGRPVPVSTYRLQLTPETGFDAAAAVVPYLADLGVTHLYCSPWLQAAPGSQHGYDVVDPTRVNDQLGGEPGLARLQAACREAGLGIVLDVVPNHLAISEPESQNRAWWSLLRDGPASPYASWFDVEWDSADNPGRVLVPVLGAPLGQCLDELELLEDRIRYYDHEVPLAPGTRVDGDVLATLERQHYRLAFWRIAGEELDYRRFFDVTTLAGVRVELPEVFDATHQLVVPQVRDGLVDGLRVDHPDGLADPEAYLRRLADATGGSWVVAEKILEAAVHEELPDSWPCAGTTGYDVLNRLLGVFVDPAGEQPLTDVYAAVTGAPTDWHAVVDAAKRQVLDSVLRAEVDRLVTLLRRICALDPVLRDHTRRELEEALVELLAAFEVYRAYVPADGRPADPVARRQVEDAAERARAAAPPRADAIDLVRDLALGEGLTTARGRGLRAEFVTRFQQTCGPVMAKGIEDTAFYRYGRLVALNEVGGDPGRFGTAPEELMTAAAAAQRDWPLSMTALSTHDTKRSEDVRARLALLSECPREWSDAVTGWVAHNAGARTAGLPDRATEYFLYQSLVGAWPLPADRARAYAEKASREAKARTSWTDPDPAFDAALAGFVDAVLSDEGFTASVQELVDRLAPAWGTTVLAQKLLQLVLPGVADTYQGTELVDLSLVDPDNRRPVDWDRRRTLLAALDAAGRAPDPADLDAAKLWVVSRALRLRRERPQAFLAEATFDALPVRGRAAAHLVACARSGQVVALVPRLALGLARRGGWGDTTVQLPEGTWSDLLTGAAVQGGERPVAQLLGAFPVALLVRA